MACSVPADAGSTGIISTDTTPLPPNKLRTPKPPFVTENAGPKSFSSVPLSLHNTTRHLRQTHALLSYFTTGQRHHHHHPTLIGSCDENEQVMERSALEEQKNKLAAGTLATPRRLRESRSRDSARIISEDDPLMLSQTSSLHPQRNQTATSSHTPEPHAHNTPPLEKNAGPKSFFSNRHLPNNIPTKKNPTCAFISVAAMVCMV